MTQQERLVVVEGYDDRDFLHGWLTIQGCVKQSKDTQGRPVRMGPRGYRARDGHFVRLVAANSKDRFDEALREHFMCFRDVRDYDGIWVVRDADAADMSHAMASLNSLCDRFAVENAVFHPMVWFSEKAWEAVAASQTLESIIASALHDVDPARAEAVLSWLRADPSAVDPGGKPVVWSHFGKWRSEDGAARFIQGLWEDDDVAIRLEHHLATTSALAELRALAGINPS